MASRKEDFFDRFQDSPWVDRGSGPEAEAKVKAEFGQKFSKVEKTLKDPDFFDNLKLLFNYLVKGRDIAPKALIVGALLYFISPVDLIPDFLPGAGYLDDIAVVAGVVTALADLLRRFRDDQARASAAAPPESKEAAPPDPV